MANIDSLDSRVKILEDWKIALMANSKLPNEMTKSEKELLLDNLYPRILNNGVYYRTDKKNNTDYTAFEIGDVIRHIDDVNKVSYVGRVLNATLTLPADFTDTSKIELYNKDKPAFSL